MPYNWFHSNAINDISGIRTPREDVRMNSVPTTTREEKALFRTSGGCQSTGRPVQPGQSTTAGPSTLTNLLRRRTLAPHRLRSLPRTPALRQSGLQSQTQWQILTGTTGKHKSMTVLAKKLIWPFSPRSKPHTCC